MRLSNIILCTLPALAAAEQQVPLQERVKGWINKAQSYIPTAVPSVPNPINAGASKVAGQVVTPVTLGNWRSVLKPSASAAYEGPEEWMVFLTGANKTCYGACDHAEKAWNESVALLSALPRAPHLASINCDDEQVLCNSWSAGPPSIYHMLLPRPLPDQSTPATTVRYIRLNGTSVTAAEIAALHTEEKYKETPPYEGLLHPFDGLVPKAGLAIPLGWLIWGISKMPSWLPMIAISLFSRTMMRGRGQPGAQQPGGARPAGAGGPAPAR